MPKEGLNVYFSIRDDGSAVLTSIGDKTKALDKETQELAQTYAALKKANEPLIRQQAELEKQLSAAKRETGEAEKAFKRLGDAASDEAFTKAKEKQNALHAALAETKSMIQENERAYKSNIDMIRKEALSMDDSNAMTKLGIGLISGQVGEMFSTSVGKALETVFTSGIGMPAASLLSDTVGDAITGAAAGMMFGLPGAVVGGIAGATSGLISGSTKIFEAKDDAFKDYYTGLYDSVNAETEETISGGSSIAGSREQTFKAFAKRLGGNEEAEEYLERVKTMAAGTNYDYDEITGYSKLLLNTYDPDEVFDVLQKLSDATAGLDLTSSDVSVMISGLSRMRTTGKTTQEYLNYFSERGIDVYEALSGFAGGDKSKVAEKVTKGEIEGADAAQAILDYIEVQYGGLSGDLMSTYNAMTANLEDIMSSLTAAAGEGYNETRKLGLEADMDAYGGALGKALEEINRISGENKAYLENLEGQYTRQALEAVLLGGKAESFSEEDRQKLEAMAHDYAQAEKDYSNGDTQAGLALERLIEDTRALATAAYESSDEYQLYMDDQLDQIAQIREHTATMAAAANEYLIRQEESKGTMDTAAKRLDTISIINAATGMDTETPETLSFWQMLGNAAANAALGISGNMPIAPLEKKAQETAASAGGISVTVTGNTFQGTDEELAHRVAEVIVLEMQRAQIAAAPR